MEKILIICFCLIFISGCSTKPDDISDPSYRRVDSELTYEQTQDGHMDKKVSEEEPTLTNSVDPLSSFHGIASEAETPSSGNITINTKLVGNSCLVSPDIENGVTYYVNYGNDYYIYQLKNGISTLVLDKKTKYIQVWEGELYYLGFDDKEENDYINKNIYKYNLSTKEEKLLIETMVMNMYINSNGLYFTKINLEDELKCDGYKFSFDSSTIEPAEWDHFTYYKDYILVFEQDYLYDPGLIKLIKQDTGECILEIPDVRQNIGIYHDYLCFTKKKNNNQKMYVLNLNTGEQKEFDPNNISPDGTNGISFDIFDFTVIGDTVYFVTGTQFIFQCNIEDETITMKMVNNGKNISADFFENISADFYDYTFTDGNHLFVTKRISGGGIKLANMNKSIVELIVVDSQITEKELGK